MTALEIKKINEINGTLETRAEYLKKIAEIVGGKIGNSTFRYNINCVNRVVVNETVIDITIAKRKDKRFITEICIIEYNSKWELINIHTMFADKKTKQFEF